MGDMEQGRRNPEVDKMRKMQILKHLSTEDATGLFRRANRVRRHFVGEDVHLRTILGVSSFCQSDCLFCGKRLSNPHVKRKRLSPEEIIMVCREATEAGVRTVILEAGVANQLGGPETAQLIRSIKAVDPSVAVTLAFGKRSERDFNRWREAGADRYMLLFETSNPKLFSYFRPGHTIEERIRTIRILQKVGFQVATGMMVGLPRQSLSDIADDLLMLKRLDIDMVKIHPFIPHPDSPLAKFPPCDPDLLKRVIAVARIILKEIHIQGPVDFTAHAPETFWETFDCGANTIPLDITPTTHEAHFYIHRGRRSSNAPIAEQLEEFRLRLKQIGRRLSSSRGDAFSFKNKRSARKPLFPGDLVTIKQVTPSQWLSDKRRKANWV